jgi:hypothetical protein
MLPCHKVIYRLQGLVVNAGKAVPFKKTEDFERRAERNHHQLDEDNESLAKP